MLMAALGYCPGIQAEYWAVWEQGELPPCHSINSSKLTSIGAAALFFTYKVQSDIDDRVTMIQIYTEHKTIQVTGNRGLT